MLSLTRRCETLFAMGIADRETRRKLTEAKRLTFAKSVVVALVRESYSRELSGTSGKDEGDGMHEETLGILHTSTPVKASKEPWTTTMVIDQVPVKMEIDTGSGKSLPGKDTWKQSFPKKKLRETPVNLITYSGEKLPLLGTCLVEVQHQRRVIVWSCS